MEGAKKFGQEQDLNGRIKPVLCLKKCWSKADSLTIGTEYSRLFYLQTLPHVCSVQSVTPLKCVKIDVGFQGALADFTGAFWWTYWHSASSWLYFALDIHQPVGCINHKVNGALNNVYVACNVKNNNKLNSWETQKQCQILFVILDPGYNRHGLVLE